MSRRRLLLADDSITIQKVVNLTFADEGIEVFAVGDGNEAIDRLLEIAPDLVMADVNMPGINGYQVCERIKQQEKFKDTPVILLVGSFEPFDQEEAARVGADDYLTKPFQSIRQLVNKVSELLQASENGELKSRAMASDAVESTDSTETEQMVEVQTDQTQFAETIENIMPYDDAGMDDEMIETNRATGFAYDEVQKFSSNSYAAESKDDEEDDYGKTQPLSAADWQEINTTNENFQSDAAEYRQPETEEEASPETENYSAAEAAENAAEGFSTSGNYAVETTADAQSEYSPENTPRNTVSLLDDDEDDFLELPSFEDEFEEEEAENVEAQKMEDAAVQQSASTETAGETAAMAQGETTETAGSVESEAPPASDVSVPNQLSPEMIDAIAQRVIEKLSDRTVKEIAWEVVPQQADLIIKKMVAEKLNE